MQNKKKNIRSKGSASSGLVIYSHFYFHPLHPIRPCPPPLLLSGEKSSFPLALRALVPCSHALARELGRAKEHLPRGHALTVDVFCSRFLDFKILGPSRSPWDRVASSAGDRGGRRALRAAEGLISPYRPFFFTCASSSVLLVLLASSTVAQRLNWGLCDQDRGKCATTVVSGCKSDSGAMWTDQTCVWSMCMRCWQAPDGSTASQIASLGKQDCAATEADMHTDCSRADLKWAAVYDVADKCIDFGTGRSLNCKAALIAHQTRLESGPVPEATSASELTTSPAVSGGGGGFVMSPGVIAGAAAGGLALVAIIIIGSVWAYKRASTIRLAKQHQNQLTSRSSSAASINGDAAADSHDFSTSDVIENLGGEKGEWLL